MVTNAHLKPVRLEDNTPLAVEQRLGQLVEIQISLGTIRIEYVVERTTKKMPQFKAVMFRDGNAHGQSVLWNILI